jgi:hypothetical protein
MSATNNYGVLAPSVVLPLKHVHKQARTLVGMPPLCSLSSTSSVATEPDLAGGASVTTDPEYPCVPEVLPLEDLMEPEAISLVWLPPIEVDATPPTWALLCLGTWDDTPSSPSSVAIEVLAAVVPNSSE